MADDRLLDYDRATMALAAAEQLDDRDADEPQGGDADTDHRCCLGSALTGHAPDCIHSTLASMNQHVEQLEQDLATAKARIGQLEAPALRVALTAFCDGCGKEIDPETCGCGSPVGDGSYHDNHSPIPMGCSCLRVGHGDTDIARGLRERLRQVMQLVRDAGVVVEEHGREH